MNQLPFDKPGRFYRGNLHTHSTRSDGGIPPEAVIAAYRDTGYDFIALTDHFLEQYNFPIVDTRDFRTPGFTTILGAELHAPQIEVGERWHILAAGLPLDFAPTGPNENGPELAARAAAAGAFIGMAHPAWYSLTLQDALSLEAAHSVEVYNETTVQHNNRGESWYLSDLLSARGKRLTAYAADDAHFTTRPDRFGGWVQVKASTLDPDALVTALKAGHFYSSQGPEIQTITIASQHLYVSCSPAQAIFLTGRGPKALSRLGENLVEMEFPLETFKESYCRITVVDGRGKHAWSNPIWLD
ncbi:MAG: CehA/McbA family metallohydrolase [Chloroflexi bacterium]|nr:CehA/McbA family metallohydrolase [Chloroflexota bacterium]